jgi:hypothetical protein
VRSFFLILAALPTFAQANEANFDAQTRDLSSIDGNQVHVSMSRKDSPNNGNTFVSLCLSVPREHLSAKGFTTRATESQFAQPGQQTCLRVAPTAQNITLLTRSDERTSRRSMAFSADLTGYSGYTLNIEWIVEVLE